MGNQGNVEIEAELKIMAADLMPNNLLRVTFSDGETFFFHPDALSDLADDNADDDDIIWPEEYYDDLPEENIGEKLPEEEVDLSEGNDELRL